MKAGPQPGHIGAAIDPREPKLSSRQNQLEVIGVADDCVGGVLVPRSTGLRHALGG